MAGIDEKLAPISTLGTGSEATMSDKAAAKHKAQGDAFIAKATALHGDRYDYSGVQYVTAATKVTIKCPKHGDFLMRPDAHLYQKQGCPACGLENRKHPLQKTTEAFVRAATDKWGERYDYAPTRYVNKQTPITFGCVEHGLVQQMPTLHLASGCPYCAGRGIGKHTVESFVAKARQVHGDAYDYSKVDLKSINDKVVITCLEHGDFEQKAANHINLRNGCPRCMGGVSMDTALFVEKAKIVHGDRFDYSDSVYTRAHDSIKVMCKRHGEFEQRAYMHLQSDHGCPACVAELQQSKGERELGAFIASLVDCPVETNVRGLLGDRREIDIWLPTKRIGFEFHGSWFHSEAMGKPQDHIRKADAAEEHGIRLIQVWEHDWISKRAIVESRIGGILGVNRRIHARKTTLVQLTKRQKNHFLDACHIQGRDSSDLRFGLQHEGELVACMTFGRPRFSSGHDFELIRYCSALGVNVVGGAGKLLKAFRRVLPAASIITFADRQWSQGDMYRKLGFTFDGKADEGYSYFKASDKSVHNRMKFQKHRLKQMPAYQPGLSEHQIMLLSGYLRLYNAGQTRWVLGEKEGGFSPPPLTDGASVD